jgi:hypothetical protein
MSKKILLTAALFLTAASTSAFAEDWKGTISDAMCAAKHVNATKADMACAQKCVKGGSPAVLVVDGKVFKIDNQDAVKDHIGHKVSVSGTMVTEGTIHIDKVTM